MLLGFLVHLADLLGIHTGRLFHHHMNAPFHAFHGIAGMIVVRYADHACIDKAGVQHGFRIVEAYEILGKIFLRPLETVRIDVGHCHQLEVRTFAGHQIAGVPAAHVANADNAKTDRFTHGFLPPD